MLGVNTPALPASLRRTNQRTVVSLLLRLGRASRADLAKAAGISQPTAGKITAGLLELGILREAGAGEERADAPEDQAPRLGRPGQMLRLDDRKPRFLAVELGVKETLISALPVAARTEDAWSARFDTPPSPQAWVRDLKRAAARLPRSGLWGVLVSVPGIVDETNGTVLFSPNLHWLESVSLTALVQQVWDLPVALVQEIRALALGQVIADPGGPDFLLVDFGQGVGGAIVLDGRLYTHPTPLSGEVGHTPVPGNLRPCGCGAVGCLETLVSERGLLESFAAGTGEAATWARLVARLESHGVEPWLESSLAAAGKVISGALNVLGISRVLVSGLITQLPPAAAECLFAEIQRGAMWARFGKITCQVAEHHRGAGLVAAGLDRLMLPDNDSDPSARSVFATTNE